MVLGVDNKGYVLVMDMLNSDLTAMRKINPSAITLKPKSNYPAPLYSIIDDGQIELRAKALAEMVGEEQ